MSNNQGSLVKIETSVEFLNQMVLVDYNEFLKYPTDLRRSFHLATSLFRLRDWVFHQYGPGRWKKPNNLQQYLETKCTDLALVSDIANASNHLKLRPNSRHDRNSALTGAGNVLATFVPNSAMTTPYAPSRHYQGGCYVLVSRDSGSKIRFADVAENVLKMWQQLFKDEGSK
jgi:hypothetical protein